MVISNTPDGFAEAAVFGGCLSSIQTHIFDRRGCARYASDSQFVQPSSEPALRWPAVSVWVGWALSLIATPSVHPVSCATSCLMRHHSSLMLPTSSPCLPPPPLHRKLRGRLLRRTVRYGTGYRRPLGAGQAMAI